MTTPLFWVHLLRSRIGTSGRVTFVLHASAHYASKDSNAKCSIIMKWCRDIAHTHASLAHIEETPSAFIAGSYAELSLREQCFLGSRIRERSKESVRVA